MALKQKGNMDASTERPFEKIANASLAEKRKPNNARILYLLKILKDETDSDSGLSLPQIQDRLEDYGIGVERKSLYRDLDVLDEFGIEVGRLPTRPVTYYLATRPFEPSQMMLLVDAVQTSKSITKRNAGSLVKRIKALGSKRDARNLDSRVHVAGRVRTQNESIFNTLDNIQKAIAEKRDISFNYVRHDSKMDLRNTDAHDSLDRIRTPLCIIYSNDKYYLLAFDEDASDNIRTYRIDRMAAVRLAEKSPKSHKLPSGFDPARYEQQMIGMFSGKPVSIKLQVTEDNIDNILDIFGSEDAECMPAHNVKETDPSYMASDGSSIRNWATMRIKAAPSPVLFGSLAQFGGDVRIISPKRVADAYTNHIERILESQSILADKESL